MPPILSGGAGKLAMQLRGADLDMENTHTTHARTYGVATTRTLSIKQQKVDTMNGLRQPMSNDQLKHLKTKGLQTILAARRAPTDLHFP